MTVGYDVAERVSYGTAEYTSPVAERRLDVEERNVNPNELRSLARTLLCRQEILRDALDVTLMELLDLVFAHVEHLTNLGERQAVFLERTYALD
jgi:hypothetical protein